ncbi:MAG TPA: glycosyltransferase family A protein [Acidimicrobiales bacterium]
MIAVVPGSNAPEVAVIVPTRNRPYGLQRLVRALEAQSISPDLWELVIVDDCSEEPTAMAIKKLIDASPLRTRSLRTGVSAGPAPVRNLGWRSTTSPLLAFIDDDCVPDPDWLAAGLLAINGSPRIGVVQGRTVRPARSEAYPLTCYTVVREVLKPSPWFESCNIFFRRAAIEEAGGFDETIGRFGGWFAEDTLLGWSVIEAGWERAWADDAVVEHELSDRPFRWHIQKHYLEGHLVGVAARFPQIRTMFWRPWAIKRDNALFALAVVGLVLGIRWRPALLLTVPYLRALPSPWPKVGDPEGFAHQVACHAASLAGKTVKGIQYRTVLL